MIEREPFIQEIIDEALNDPNLTTEERKQIDDIQLDAMNRARKFSENREDFSVYSRALQSELKKCEGEIQFIRGMAANRYSRRVEDF